MNKRDIPNLISILRIILVMPISYALWNQQYFLALVLFILGGISDGLDGFIARRYRWETALGVVLDPMGDKLMMLSAYLLLGWHTLLPWWLVSLVIIRDLIIVIGSLLYRKFVAHEKLKPLFISKLNTAGQIVLVIIIMFSQLTNVSTIISDGILYLVVVTTVLSGYAYINEWGRRAYAILKGREGNSL